MSNLTKSTSSRQPIEIIERHGIYFYRLPYYPDEIWVAGIDISKKLEAAYPNKHASNIYKNNEQWLQNHSKLIKVPRFDENHHPFEEGADTSENLREVRVYDEIGFNFFISRSNTKKGLDHLLHILEDYHKLKKERSKPKTIDWKQARIESKKQRRALTDAIQLFVEYAKDQGSKGAHWYYKLITQKINKTLFDVHGKGTPEGFREKLSNNELKILAVTEDQIAEYMIAKMQTGIEYKLIIEGFAKILINSRSVIDFKV